MPRYFFDLHDGPTTKPDDIGVEFPDLRAAVADCCRSLGEMMKDQLAADCAIQELAIVLRDESGARLMRATLSFGVEPVQ